LAREGRQFDLHAAGMLALDVARIEAGLILIEVDYFSSKKALIEAQKSSPAEIGLGKLVHLEKGQFIGRAALAAEQKRGGSPRRFAPACSRLSRRRADWQSYFYYLVANTKENDRAGQYRQRTFQSWHKVGNGNDGGSRPPPRGSHGTRAAVLQSTEKDGDTGLD